MCANKRQHDNVDFRMIEKFLKKIFLDTFEPKFLPFYSTLPILKPEVNLFLWALLLNRTETAKIFWKIGEVNQLKTAVNLLIYSQTLNFLVSNKNSSVWLSTIKKNVKACSWFEDRIMWNSWVYNLLQHLKWRNSCSCHFY